MSEITSMSHRRPSMMTPQHVPRSLNKMKEVRKDIDISEHKIGIEEVLVMYKLPMISSKSKLFQ